MSSLCDMQIVARCRAGNESDLVFPFDGSLVDPCSYRLQLGSHYWVEMTNRDGPVCRAVEEAVEPWNKSWIDECALNGWIIIHPGELIQASTVESVNLTGLLCARLANLDEISHGGLFVYLTDGIISPGHRGKVTFMIKNNGCTTIKLAVGSSIARIIFEQCDAMPDKRYGKRPDDAYQGSTGPTAALPFS